MFWWFVIIYIGNLLIVMLFFWIGILVKVLFKVVCLVFRFFFLLNYINLVFNYNKYGIIDFIVEFVLLCIVNK